MALFSFGKKDKKPPEASDPVAKTPPTPPKIQTPPAPGNSPSVKAAQPSGLMPPPAPGNFPPVKAPQPSGLMPPPAMPAGAVTTQPMSMPRTGMTGLKPARPGAAQTRSTQRIILPSSAGSRPNSTKPLSMGTPSGRINLPIGMILRCLPPEVLAADLSEFEASGAAATEIGLPMNMILGQLPSGKVEMAFQDLVPHFPAGYLQPTESIASYLPNIISLPLMDVVMRIPPDLLAVRPDQKDVDASVINMADPFTEEILREQAEAARRQSQTNIIDESQAPQEEFVPRDQTETVKPAAPQPPPPAETPVPSRPPAPMPVAAPPPAPPVAAKMPTLTRSTTPVPIRPQGAVAPQLVAPPPLQASPPVPPVPRHTGAIPAPPPPRHTASLPMPLPRATASFTAPSQPAVPAIAPQEPAPAEKPVVPQEPTQAEKVAGAPDADAGDLQRLAALAMTQLGDSTESPTGVPPQPAPVAAPAPEPKIEEPAPAIASAPAPAPAIRPPPPPIPAPIPTAEPPVSPKAVSEPLPSSAAAQAPAEPKAHATAASMAFNLNTCTAEDLVQNIPGCSRDVAESIVEYRTRIGSFKRLEDLLEVPGITKAAYTHLTGEAPPANRIPLSLNELLGFPAEQHISLKDVTERIACWPDVTGCVLSQSSGLTLVGTAPEGVDKTALVAFAPRMFEAINKSFSEVCGQETDALVIPTTGTSFHLFRNRDLYLIIMSRLPQMPERHVKVARFVLAALSIRRD